MILTGCQKLLQDGTMKYNEAEMIILNMGYNIKFDKIK